MKYIQTFMLTWLLILISGTGAQSGENKPDAASTAMKEKRLVATVGTDGVQHVQMIGGEYYFDPNYVVVKVNVPVELTVKKSADASSFVPHDLIAKAPEAGIDFKVDLKAEARSVVFTPTKTGKFPLYCDKKPPFGKSHKDRGMEGFIEVVE